MSDWVGIFIILISLFCGGFALGVKWGESMIDFLKALPSAQPDLQQTCNKLATDCISRQDAVSRFSDLLMVELKGKRLPTWDEVYNAMQDVPSAQPVVQCKDCKHWRRQTNYAGVQLSFGFCESDDMWRSLYGETCEVSHIDTDDDFYCGHAERREDG